MNGLELLKVAGCGWIRPGGEIELIVASYYSTAVEHFADFRLVPRSAEAIAEGTKKLGGRPAATHWLICNLATIPPADAGAVIEAAGGISGVEYAVREILEAGGQENGTL